MVYRTLDGVLCPDGRVILPHDELPDRPVRMMVTILADEDAALTDVGDYLHHLQDYEEKLARGEVQWQ